MALLPSWVVLICGASAAIAAAISLVGIHLQFMNYRKPLEQRLVVRIQLIVPLFALSCYAALRWHTLSALLAPLREMYEAFVIYTFFTLLTRLLGGERNIVIIASGRPPIKQPLFLPPVDVSDPFTLLAIKRGVLQYVWLKPLICAASALCDVMGPENTGEGLMSGAFIINAVYNISVSVSLYSLALFWRCLYQDLRPFNPWGKFLCVKLIIFASYWQGVILGLLSYFGILSDSDADLRSGKGLAFAIQNALLCVELIGFAIGHWHSFSWTEYSPQTLHGCGRLSFAAALRDTFGCGDLIYDFKMTFSGDEYDYRHFDSVEALVAHPLSRSRMARFNDGLRFSDSGKNRYWLPKQQMQQAQAQSPHSKTPLLQRPRANSIRSTTTSTRAIYANSVLTIDSKENGGLINEVSPSQSNNYNAIDGSLDADEDWKELHDYLIDEEFYAKVKRERPYGDKNYPVIYDIEAHTNSPALQRLRRQAMARQAFA